MSGSPNSEASKPHRPGNIGARRSLARLSLFWEQAWPLLWPPIGIAGAFLVLALLDVFAYLPGWLHMLAILIFFATLARAAWRAVRTLLAHEVDLVKIASTGGVSDSRRLGEAGELQMTYEEIAAVVDEAHRKGFAALEATLPRYPEPKHLTPDP